MVYLCIHKISDMFPCTTFEYSNLKLAAVTAVYCDWTCFLEFRFMNIQIWNYNCNLIYSNTISYTNRKWRIFTLIRLLKTWTRFFEFWLLLNNQIWYHNCNWFIEILIFTSTCSKHISLSCHYRNYFTSNKHWCTDCTFHYRFLHKLANPEGCESA